MKIVMIAALAAAQFSATAAPAQAAEEPATARLRNDVEQKLGDRQAPELGLASAAESPRATAAQQDEPRKKRKSTGDKVLTGAAVILGVGALAVGALLVAIFVN